MTELTLNVPDIHCGHCKESIESAVGGLDGVRQVTVDIEGRTVAIAYEEPAERSAITTAIEDVGYVVD